MFQTGKERKAMDEQEQKETKSTEATPEQAGAFMAELVKTLGAQTERQNKFKTVYANNFHFEPSAWDLKIVLGQLEQHTGAPIVDWHTAVTLPWLQVKLVAYYLRIQAAWQELQNGPLKAPAYVMPTEPKPPAGELANDTAALALYEAQRKIYLEMFGA